MCGIRAVLKIILHTFYGWGGDSVSFEISNIHQSKVMSSTAGVSIETVNDSSASFSLTISDCPCVEDVAVTKIFELACTLMLGMIASVSPARRTELPPSSEVSFIDYLFFVGV